MPGVEQGTDPAREGRGWLNGEFRPSPSACAEAETAAPNRGEVIKPLGSLLCAGGAQVGARDGARPVGGAGTKVKAGKVGSRQGAPQWVESRGRGWSGGAWSEGWG